MKRRILASSICTCTALAYVLLLPSCNPIQEDSDKEKDKKSQVEGTRTPMPILPPAPSVKPPVAPSPALSMVRVDAANQADSYAQPWSKRDVEYCYGFGTYVGKGRVLTTANVVADATFIQLSTPDGVTKIPAEVECIDYDANLVLIKGKGPDAEAFFNAMVPLSLGTAPKLNDTVQIWQFGTGGVPLVSAGTIQSTINQESEQGLAPFVLYQIKTAVTAILGGGGNPIVVDNKLVGLSHSCDSGKQQMSAYTQTILSHFMEDAGSGQAYRGFPFSGTQVDALTDATFRKYLGLDAKGGGVYVAKVLSYSDMGKAGLQKGDVILAVNGKEVDAKGMVKDDKLGPVSVGIFLRDYAHVGDEVKFDISRRMEDGKGVKMTLAVKLSREAVADDIIPTVAGEVPEYYVYGGLVFVPLTDQLLREYGAATKGRFSMELLEVLNDDEKQEEIKKQGVKQIVALLFCIPTPATQGYASFGGSLVKSVDGVVVTSLKHLAELLGKNVEGGVHAIETNKSPSTIYIGHEDALRMNEVIKERAIPELQHIKQ